MGEITGGVVFKHSSKQILDACPDTEKKVSLALLVFCGFKLNNKDLCFKSMFLCSSSLQLVCVILLLAWY